MWAIYNLETNRVQVSPFTTLSPCAQLPKLFCFDVVHPWVEMEGKRKRPRGRRTPERLNTREADHRTQRGLAHSDATTVAARDANAVSTSGLKRTFSS